MEFKCLTRDRFGKVSTNVIKGRDVATIVTNLKRDGYLALKVQEIKESKNGGNSLFTLTNKRVKLKEIVGLSAKDPPPNDEEALQLIHPDDREDYVKRFDDAFNNGEDRDEEYRMIRRDGETRHIHSVSRFVRDEKGQIT